jgi:hypothetical protein
MRSLAALLSLAAIPPATQKPIPAAALDLMNFRLPTFWDFWDWPFWDMTEAPLEGNAARE